jgi:hypothetical protein
MIRVKIGNNGDCGTSGSLIVILLAILTAALLSRSFLNAIRLFSARRTLYSAFDSNYFLTSKYLHSNVRYNI